MPRVRRPKRINTRTETASITVTPLVKRLVVELTKEHGVTQMGLMEALIFTLDGRQNLGTVELDWSKVKHESPANTASSGEVQDEHLKNYFKFVGLLEEYEVIKFSNICKNTGLNEIAVRCLIKVHVIMTNTPIRRKLNFGGVVITFTDKEYSTFEISVGKRGSIKTGKLVDNMVKVLRER